MENRLNANFARHIHIVHVPNSDPSPLTFGRYSPGHDKFTMQYDALGAFDGCWQ